MGSWARRVWRSYRLTGFNYLDRIQRVGAAKLGYFYAKDLAKKLVRKPTTKGIRYQLEELRLNPDESSTP